MNRNIKAIPTIYAGTQFRSRLEAHWAAFFDRCEWRWTYEPQDMEGYIPDFKLWFRIPILVEVKPVQWDETEYDLELLDAARTKIIRSGIKGELLILGSRVVTTTPENSSLPRHVIGGVMDIDPGTDEASAWSPAFVFRCEFCTYRTFAAEMMSWHCRMSGCYDGRDHMSHWNAEEDFKRSGSQVQWMPSR